MAGSRSLGLGSFLNKVLILGLICLSGYLYWQVISLQKQLAKQSGKVVDQQSSKNPWDSYKLTLPPGLSSFGGHDVALITSAKAHMLKAHDAAQAGNFGEASKETQAADDDLKAAEAGASAQTRTAVDGLRTTVASLQHRVHAATQAFESQQ